MNPTIEQLTSQSSAIFATAKAIAAALPANTVQVWPGGATFNTITAAMNSISGQSPQDVFQVAVGPGTYNENVNMKDNVYLVGAGQDITIITAPAVANEFAGVVVSGSGGGISEVTLNAPGGVWGCSPTGIKIGGSGNFHISGVTINSGAGGSGNNVRGITNNTGSYSGQIVVGSSIINVTSNDQSGAIGIELFGTQGGSMTAFVNLCAIQVTNNQQNIGIATSNTVTSTIDDSKITAADWTLFIDPSCQMTANQCTLNGPVYPGVVVNN